MKEKVAGSWPFCLRVVRKKAVALTMACVGHQERGQSLRPGGKKNLREWELRIGLLRRVYSRLEETMKNLGEASALKTKDAFSPNSPSVF